MTLDINYHNHRIDFTLPDSVYDLILNTAQYAADLHEQKIKDAILDEKSIAWASDKKIHDLGYKLPNQPPQEGKE
jgi:hypothetical protein